jgi:DNA-binding transcriptional ArsR family regulator
MPLAQSTVSQHLKELKEHGIISQEIKGPECRYTLERGQLLQFCRAFQQAMGNAPQTAPIQSNH